MRSKIKKGKFKAQNMNDVYHIIEVGLDFIKIKMEGLSSGKIFSVPYNEVEEAFDKKFWYYLDEDDSANSMDGKSCHKCKNFSPFAESNQPDGTFICYACRHGY